MVAFDWSNMLQLAPAANESAAATGKIAAPHSWQQAQVAGLI